MNKQQNYFVYFYPSKSCVNFNATSVQSGLLVDGSSPISSGLADSIVSHKLNSVTQTAAQYGNMEF